MDSMGNTKSCRVSMNTIWNYTIENFPVFRYVWWKKSNKTRIAMMELKQRDNFFYKISKNLTLAFNNTIASPNSVPFIKIWFHSHTGSIALNRWVIRDDPWWTASSPSWRFAIEWPENKRKFQIWYFFWCLFRFFTFFTIYFAWVKTLHISLTKRNNYTTLCQVLDCILGSWKFWS